MKRYQEYKHFWLLLYFPIYLIWFYRIEHSVTEYMGGLSDELHDAKINKSELQQSNLKYFMFIIHYIYRLPQAEGCFFVIYQKKWRRSSVPTILRVLRN